MARGRPHAEFFFESPPKAEIGEHRELYFDGYVGDPVLLDRARRNEVHYMSAASVSCAGRERAALFVDNALWPDSTHVARPSWRWTWCDLSKKLVLAVSPLVLLGIFSACAGPHCARRARGACPDRARGGRVLLRRDALPRAVRFVLVLLALEGARWVASWRWGALLPRRRLGRRPGSRTPLTSSAPLRAPEPPGGLRSRERCISRAISRLGPAVAHLAVCSARLGVLSAVARCALLAVSHAEADIFAAPAWPV